MQSCKASWGATRGREEASNKGRNMGCNYGVSQHQANSQNYKAPLQKPTFSIAKVFTLADHPVGIVRVQRNCYISFVNVFRQPLLPDIELCPSPAFIDMTVFIFQWDPVQIHVEFDLQFLTNWAIHIHWVTKGSNITIGDALMDVF